MVPTEEYYPDRAYLFAFLLSARLFIKPHELLGEVCALCEHQQNLTGDSGKVSHECNRSTKAHQEPSGRALYGHRVHYRFIVSQARPPFRIHPLGESPWHARSRSSCNNEHAYPGQKCFARKWISTLTILLFSSCLAAVFCFSIFTDIFTRFYFFRLLL